MTARFPRHRLLLAAAFGAAFAVLAAVVLARHGTPYAVDTGPHRWSVAHRPSGAATTARVVTGAGAGPYPYLAAALGGWLADRRTVSARHRPATALLAVAALLAGQAVRAGVMAAARRARPPAADWAAHATGHAFPSGHTSSSAIAAGLLAWGLLRVRPGAVGRVAAVACALVAAAIGGTRVYLGVHWPTDVLGGWLFAAFWLAVSLPLLTAFAAAGGGGGEAAAGPGA